MLDIWLPLDENDLRQILDYQAHTSGERLDVGRVAAFRSTICPYKDFELFRLEISPQVITRSGGNVTLSSRALSHFLLKRAPNHEISYTLPFFRDMESIIAVNKIAGLRLSNSSVLEYVTVLGIMMHAPPFYFITNVGQISTLLRESTDAAELHIRDKIEALFRVDKATGRIGVDLFERGYPLLGRCFKVRVPCIYSGSLFAAVLRISENGTPHMDEDQRFNIEGIIDHDAQLSYYPLVKSKEIDERYRRGLRSHRKWVASSVVALAGERLSSYLLFPLFLFNIFFAIFFGQDIPEVRGYFILLQSSTFLSVLSLASGLVFVVIFAARLFILYVVDYTNSLVPNPFGVLTHAMRSQSQAAVRRYGFVGVMLAAAIEFTMSAVLGLTLMSYGILNLFGNIIGSIRLDFWATFATVLWATPLFGDWLLELIISPNIRSLVRAADTPGWFLGVIGFMYSTVLVSLLAKIGTYGKEK